MSKSARLLAILNMIRNNRAMSTMRLAEKCQVSERTIYRDILTLAEAGAPLYYDKGYRLLPGTFLPPLNLTVEEYLTLKVALFGTPLSMMKSYSAEIGNLIAKIDAAVNSHITDQLKSQSPRLLIKPKATSDVARGDVIIRLLKQAIDGDNVVRLTYKSISSGETLRRVDPYFVVFRGKAWYLLGYCHLRKEMRLFRIDRIIKVAFTNERFSRDGNVTPEKYFESSWELYSGEPIEVKLRLQGAAAAVVATGKRHATEIVEPRGDGSVVYTVTVAGIEEILRWILGFGGNAEVLAPPELAVRVRHAAKQILKNYS